MRQKSNGALFNSYFRQILLFMQYKMFRLFPFVDFLIKEFSLEVIPQLLLLVFCNPKWVRKVLLEVYMLIRYFILSSHYIGMKFV